MNFFKRDNKKILLGQLLIKENLISEGQLQKAIEQQRKTGQRLGDIIAEWDLLSRKQISAVLRRQRNLRFIASILTALLGPVPALTATAAVPIDVSVKTTNTKNTNVEKVAPRNLTFGSIAGLEVTEIPMDSISITWPEQKSEIGNKFAKSVRRVSDDSWADELVQNSNNIQSDDSKNAALHIIDQHHSRVASAIRNMWGYPECGKYINKLLMEGDDDRGHARAGFHQEAVEAMFVLANLHEKLMSKKGDLPFNFPLHSSKSFATLSA